MYLVYPSGSVSSGGNDGIGSVYASYGKMMQLLYTKFIQNYWWLRSPDTDYGYDNYFAWHVRSNGVVYDNYGVGDSGVVISYGHIIAGHVRLRHRLAS